jgi:hypothetical protein
LDWSASPLATVAGSLSLTGGHPYGFMCEDLKLTVKHPIRDSREAAISGGFMGAAINVGEVYVQLVRDLRECTYTHRALNTLFTMLV